MISTLTVGRSCARQAVGGRVTAKCQTTVHGWQTIAEKFRAINQEFAGMQMCCTKIKEKHDPNEQNLLFWGSLHGAAVLPEMSVKR